MTNRELLQTFFPETRQRYSTDLRLMESVKDSCVQSFCMEAPSGARTPPQEMYCFVMYCFLV